MVVRAPQSITSKEKFTEYRVYHIYVENQCTYDDAHEGISHQLYIRLIKFTLCKAFSPFFFFSPCFPCYSRIAQFELCNAFSRFFFVSPCFPCFPCSTSNEPSRGLSAPYISVDIHQSATFVLYPTNSGRLPLLIARGNWLQRRLL